MDNMNMNTSAKTKRPRKLGALDWIIIIALIVSAVCFMLRYRKKAEIQETAVSGKYEITFAVDNVRSTTADAFISGDSVYVATDDHCIGTFDRLTSNNPAAYYADDMKGGLIKVYYPEGTRIDLTGTILSEGVMNDDGYFVGGSYFLAPGKKITIYTGHVFLEITITNIYEHVE